MIVAGIQDRSAQPQRRESTTVGSVFEPISDRRFSSSRVNQQLTVFHIRMN